MGFVMYSIDVLAEAGLNHCNQVYYRYIDNDLSRILGAKLSFFWDLITVAWNKLQGVSKVRAST